MGKKERLLRLMKLPMKVYGEFDSRTKFAFHQESESVADVLVFKMEKTSVHTTFWEKSGF